MRFILLCLFCIGFASSSWAGQPTKEWTILVFINGNNDLDEYGIQDINEMEQVGSTKNINVVVQWASLANKTTTPRLFIQKDNDTTKVSSPEVMTLPKVDMGDYLTLVDFIDWGVQNYPAKKYFIIVWNHGYGWHGWWQRKKDGSGNDMLIKEISKDELTGNKINTPDLGKAMAAATKAIGHPVDLYGSDACFMASLEVAAEMLGYVNVSVGSEDMEPEDGWYYADFLKILAKNPSMNETELAAAVVETYHKGNQSKEEPADTTLSAFDLRLFGPILENYRLLSEKILAANEDTKENVWYAGDFSQRFWQQNDYKDAADFFVQLRKLNNMGSEADGLPRDLIAQSHNSILKAITINRVSDRFPHAKGMSIWFPPSRLSMNKYLDYYRTLKFDQMTGWSRVLESVIPE